MKLNYLLLTPLLLLSTQVFADVTGAWIGDDAYNTAGNGNYFGCTAISLKVSQTPSSLHIERSAYACINFSLGSSVIDFDINGNDLIYNGSPVGTITDHSYDFQFVDVNGILFLKNQVWTQSLTLNSDGQSKFNESLKIPFVIQYKVSATMH